MGTVEIFLTILGLLNGYQLFVINGLRSQVKELDRRLFEIVKERKNE